MHNLNRVELIGCLGRDPEKRNFSNGGAVLNMRIATSERWRDSQTGEPREKTEWHSVAVFGDGLIKACENALRKGSFVRVEGKLVTRKWQDQSGADRYSTEIHVIGGRGEVGFLDRLGGSGGSSGGYGGGASGGASGGAGGPASGGSSQPPGGRSNFDDEIPF